MTLVCHLACVTRGMARVWQRARTRRTAGCLTRAATLRQQTAARGINDMGLSRHTGAQRLPSCYTIAACYRIQRRRLPHLLPLCDAYAKRWARGCGSIFALILRPVPARGPPVLRSGMRAATTRATAAHRLRRAYWQFKGVTPRRTYAAALCTRWLRRTRNVFIIRGMWQHGVTRHIKAGDRTPQRAYCAAVPVTHCRTRTVCRIAWHQTRGLPRGAVHDIVELSTRCVFSHCAARGVVSVTHLRCRGNGLLRGSNGSAYIARAARLLAAARQRRASWRAAAHARVAAHASTRCAARSASTPLVARA